MTSLFARITRFLREAFTRNLGLKALSLAFALGLVAFQRGQLDEQQRTVPVAVVLRLPPESAQRELMTTVPANIHVTLHGTSRALDQLLHTGVTPVELDLRSGQVETITFERSMFSLPPGVELKIIDPPSLSLEWEDVVVRSIPLQASRTGQPARGYSVKENLAVEPKQIQVKGPASLVEVMQFARLSAFDVTGLTEGVYRRRIAIDPPPPRIKYLGPDSAVVTLSIGRRESEAKFPNRPVEVVGAPRAWAIPRAVDVTVTGPPEVVGALRAEQVVPRVDLSSAGIDLKEKPHGSEVLKVRVDLANAEAEAQPPTINVKW